MNNDLRTIKVISNFPIGDIAKTRRELLCKAEVISYLARFQDQFTNIDDINEREIYVKQFLTDTLAVSKEEKMPDLLEAEMTLKLSSGFVKDYNKIQIIKENNPNYNLAFEYISQEMNLDKQNHKEK